MKRVAVIVRSLMTWSPHLGHRWGLWPAGRAESRYDLVILLPVKTAISLPDETYARVDEAARKLGVSRSEIFARAAERWLDALDDDRTTAEIDRALEGVEVDTAFVTRAAGMLAHDDER